MEPGETEKETMSALQTIKNSDEKTTRICKKCVGTGRVEYQWDNGLCYSCMGTGGAAGRTLVGDALQKIKDAKIAGRRAAFVKTLNELAESRSLRKTETGLEWLCSCGEHRPVEITHSDDLGYSIRELTDCHNDFTDIPW